MATIWVYENKRSGFGCLLLKVYQKGIAHDLYCSLLRKSVFVLVVVCERCLFVLVVRLRATLAAGIMVTHKKHTKPSDCTKGARH